MFFLNSISKKVMAGYAAILIVLAFTAVWLNNQTAAVNLNNKTLVETTLPALQSIDTISIELNAIQLAAFGLYGTTLSSSAFRQAFANHSQNIETELDSFRDAYKGKNSDGQQLPQKIDQLLKSVTNLQNIMSQSSVNWDSARRQLATIGSDGVDANDDLDALQRSIGQDAELRANQISEQISSIRFMVPVFIALIGGITIASFILTRSTIVNPIRSLSIQLDRIAADHDLRTAIDLSANDEIGTTAKSVNVLIQSFRSGSQEVRDSTNSLMDSVQQLNGSAATSDAQVDILSQHLEQLLNGIASLETSIESSAHRSNSASEAAQSNASDVKTGAENVRRTSTSISELAKNIEVSTNKLLTLQNAGDQVSSVVRTIADIAEQTNLLALNAAIEAARAGESGRGFAVVADEVRTLASRTHDSTHEINSILESIVKSIGETVQQMDSNSEKAKNTVELAESTVSSLAAIELSVTQLSEENNALSEHSQMTMSDAGAMRSSIDEIQGVAQKVSESSAGTKAASDSLAELAMSLDSVASSFKS